MHHQGEQLQQLINYQYACYTFIEEMMRMLATGMAVDMYQFPTMPAFLVCPLVEEHASLQLMDDEDDEGDEAKE